MTGNLPRGLDERRITLPARCVHSLRLHHEQQQREHRAAGTVWQHSGRVLTTVQGRAVDPTNLSRFFRTLLRKAGLRHIRSHDLRHSIATALLEQGVELVVQLLGHAHIGVTATVYAHVRLRLQRDVIDLLGRALDRPDTYANGGGRHLVSAAVAAVKRQNGPCR
ncbi:tyrosine-type recombinase/integrase [Streptomyces sp. AC563]|nr:tyrosine-type recombinase/integrase [Streptomyces buecherae]